MISSNRIAEKEAYAKLVNQQANVETFAFSVQTVPQTQGFITLSDTAFVVDPKALQKGKQLKDIVGEKAVDNTNKLSLQMMFKSAVKDYSFLIILKNAQLSDIRIFKVQLTYSAS